ncbi:helix-turn-helix domain-containing protein [Streptomyces rochei]|uniref:helix-turn-helix domain-containing protein n=1 Tax=Streptomyces rochei TaxID=1928 RepID=UPI0036820517
MYINPPLHEIDPADLMTAAEAAEWLHVTPGAIRVWVHRGKLQAVDTGDNGPKLYHRLALAHAEREAWNNGADRPLRGGRKTSRAA